MDCRLLLAAFLLSVAVCVNSQQHSWMEGNKFLETFKRQMEEAAIHFEDLVGKEDRSREELEDDDKNARNPDEDSDEDDDGPDKKADDSNSDEDDADLSSVFQSFPSFFNILRNPAMKPWWDGPNVCVERDVKESENENKTDVSGNNFFIFGSAQFSSCKQSPNKYSCTTVVKDGSGKTKTTTVSYQCCHGYRRAPGNAGCVKLETKSLDEMSDEEGCSQFAEMLKAASLSELKDNDNVTLFAPTDKAMADFKSEGDNSFKGGLFTNEVMDEARPMDSGNKQLVLSHFVKGLIVTDEMYNDKVVQSLNDNSVVRINVFPSRRGATVTVNCARLNKTDRISTGGVLHTIDRVLQPVTKSIMDILNQPNYSKFKQLLEDKDLLKKLDGPGPFTVLALTNQAMDNTDSKKMCMHKILEHHILPHTVCSEAARDGKISALDLVSNWLKLEMTEAGELVFDNDVKASRTDIQATNGVIHEVDSFIVPSSAKSAIELLRSANRTRFLEMLEKTGMTEVVDGLEDVTVFVPSEQGLESSKDELQSLSEEDLKRVVSFHVVPKRVGSDDLSNNDKLATLDDDKPLTVSLVNNILTGLAGLGTRALIQCSPVTRIDGDVCNGVVHEILTPALPPTMSIYDSIQSRPELAKFKEVLEGTKLEEELKGGKMQDITLLAPTSKAFSEMSSGNLEIMLKDKDLADQILRNHILKGTVCCSGIGASTWPFLASERTVGGSILETNRSMRTRKVSFAGVQTDKCDIPHTDGLIHTLQGVIILRDQKPKLGSTDIVFRRPYSDIILTGL